MEIKINREDDNIGYIQTEEFKFQIDENDPQEYALKEGCIKISSILGNEENYNKLVEIIRGEENNSERDTMRYFEDYNPYNDLRGSLFEKRISSESENSFISEKYQPYFVCVNTDSGYARILFNAPHKDMMIRVEVNSHYDSLEEILMENYAKPQKLENDIVVMNNNTIPKYLKRTLFSCLKN